MTQNQKTNANNITHPRLRFIIPLKPISTNRMHGVFRGRKIKSREGREFEIICNNLLAAFFDQAKIFIENFDENSQAIRVEYKFYFPYHELVTKNGTLMKRRNDVDNMVKVFQDQVFKFMGIDDSLVTEIRAQKIPSCAHWTEIVLQAINIPDEAPLPELPNFSELDH